MYVPKTFAVEALSELHDVIDEIGVAHLVTRRGAGLSPSVVPLVLERVRGSKGARLGHLARANDQLTTSDLGSEALAIFAGPDVYVSPSLYPSKVDDGRVVPTWNYVVVHVTGDVVVHDDPQWTLDLVRRLTERHEARRTEPWSVEDAPVDYIERMVRAVVGFELVISGVEGKRKLSQNRPTDVEAVRIGLATGDPRERRVAEAMTPPAATGDRPHRP